MKLYGPGDVMNRGQVDLLVVCSRKDGFPI